MNLQAALDTLKLQLIEALDNYRTAVRYQDRDSIWYYRGRVEAAQDAVDVLEAALGDSK